MLQKLRMPVPAGITKPMFTIREPPVGAHRRVSTRNIRNILSHVYSQSAYTTSSLAGLIRHGRLSQANTDSVDYYLSTYHRIAIFALFLKIKHEAHLPRIEMMALR